MGFQFAETMAGTMALEASPGAKQPFRFEITARAESLRAHVRDGRMTVTGVMYAPPLARAAPTTGTLTIRPVGQRIIRYELAFTGDDGRPYELVGQKDIRWLAPRQSFTELPAEVLDGDGRRVATVVARFDLEHDLRSFVRSFRLA